MSTILDYTNWKRLFEQEAAQGGSVFTYSENENPTDREIENSRNMQQYLVNLFGGKNTLDGLVGKTVYLYSKPGILKENEYVKFTIAGWEKKTNPNGKVENLYLYSDATAKVKVPYIRISNIYSIKTIGYHKNNTDSLGTKTYNEPLVNAIRSLMGGKPYNA